MLHDFPEPKKEEEKIPPNLRVPSTWYPSPEQKNSQQLIVEEKFTDLNAKILKLKLNNKFDSKNLTDLKNIKNRPDLKIVQTDKNLGLCILKTLDYHKFITKQLENPVYRNINNNEIDIEDWIEHIVISRYKKNISQLLKKHEKKFAEHDYYNMTYYGFFHGLPKIHKNKPFHETPIRPIIASRPNQFQSRISIILTERLLPKLKEFDTILKDSYILKQKIENLSCMDKLFVSIDFESLYTSIPLNDLFETIQSYPTWTIEFKSQTIALLQFIFSNNYFIYANDYYQQMDGIAMGTNVAPVIANLYLALKFDRIIRNMNYIENYYRFIDDCFLMFTGNLENFERNILPDIRDAAKPLTITYEVNSNSLDFLDLTIFNYNDRIATKIFQKRLNTYAYIPPFSKHPPATISGFIKGELTRYQRLCTLEEDIHEIRRLFFERLTQRGYSKEFLKKIFEGVRHRNGLPSTSSPRTPANLNQEDDHINIVIRYSDNSKLYRYLRQEIQKIADTVFMDEDGKRVRIAYKSNPNVQKLTMRSALTPEQLLHIRNSPV
jgi:hypothetical protein